MRPHKIQSSGRYHALSLILLGYFLLFNSFCSFSQTCPGTLGSFTYDTVMVGSGGGATWNIIAPQFQTSPKVLYAVVAKSIISYSGMVGLFNNTSVPLPSMTAISNRQDQIQTTSVLYASPAAVASDPVTGVPWSVTTGPIGIFNLVSLPFVFSGYQSLYDSMTPANTNLVDFQGSGIVHITYSAHNNFIASPAGSALSSVDHSTHFFLTYYFCDPGPLESQDISFTASHKRDNSIDLSWSTAGEVTGRLYNVEVSRDGLIYSNYTSISSNPENLFASYSFSYPLNLTDSGIRYFRLLVNNMNGSRWYSAVRMIDLGSATGTLEMSLYPNPAKDFVQVSIPRRVGSGSGWAVDLLGATGDIIQQDRYSSGNFLTVLFRRNLAPGVYFLRVSDLSGQGHFVSSFVVSGSK